MAKKSKGFTSAGRYALSLLILGSAVGLTTLMFLSREKAETRDNLDLLQTVSVYKAELFQEQLEIGVSGIVEPHREVQIASQVSGEVSDKSPDCRAGTWVEAGTTLLTIDSERYSLIYDRQVAEKAQAEASVKELADELAGLDRSLKLVQRDYDLQEREYERRLGAGSALSQSEMDQARRNVNSAERSLTDIKNNIKLANSRRARLESAIDLSEVRLKEAQLDKDRCEIKAPFDGVIVSDMVEKGDYVSAGKDVIVLEDTSMTDVKCNLRVEQLQQIVKYQIPDSRFQNEPSAAYQLPPTPVSVSREIDGAITNWDGTLVRFDGIGVDSQTKMVPCRVVVEKPVTMAGGQPRALVRGMFVRVAILLNVAESDHETLLKFPEIALQPGNYVWSVRDGKLRRSKVEVVDRKNPNDPNPRLRMVVVRVKPGELADGDSIVVSPLAQPNPGTEVKSVDARLTTNSDEVGNPDAEQMASPGTPDAEKTTRDAKADTLKSKATSVKKDGGATRS